MPTEKQNSGLHKITKSNRQSGDNRIVLFWFRMNGGKALEFHSMKCA